MFLIGRVRWSNQLFLDIGQPKRVLAWQNQKKCLSILVTKEIALLTVLILNPVIKVIFRRRNSKLDMFWFSFNPLRRSRKDWAKKSEQEKLKHSQVNSAIVQVKVSRIPESELPYMGRNQGWQQSYPLFSTGYGLRSHNNSGSVACIYAHTPMLTAEIWKFPFPENIFIIKSGWLIILLIILVCLFEYFLHPFIIP